MISTSASLHALRLRARAAGVSRDPDEIPFLVRLMDSDEQDDGLEVSQVAALALAQYGFDTVIDAAGSLLGSPRARTRIALAYALGKTQDPRALQELKGLSNDPNDQVVLWTALALADLGGCAVPVLMQRLQEVFAVSLTRAVFFADGIAKIDHREGSSSLEAALAELSGPIREKVAQIVADIGELDGEGCD